MASRTKHAWPWYALGLLIGWSRVHVRIHHPSDVVGGAVVGLVLGRIALRVLPRVRGR
jgi:undecaprenyl-diphosphatase